LAELEDLAGEAPGGGLAAGWLTTGWLAAPPSAWLLPAGAAVLPALEEALATKAQTLKWKVAAGHDALERQMLEVVLERLPEGARLRLDANGGWDRATAAAWAERLAGEPRLEWLEQPLADDDLEGLEALADRLPVALDESLWRHPWLRQRWSGWQVRRPALEGDPRPLLAALAAGRAGWMVSTAFETAVGRRLVEHAAALQWRGPTPTAPGLAPQWRPTGPLFDADPAVAWASLEAEGP
jgi:O-succinylbenzoate synthase